MAFALRFVRDHPMMLAVFLVFLFWTAYLFIVSPQAIIERIGLKNSYLVVFFLALGGGISVFTSSSYFVSVAGFAGGVSYTEALPEGVSASFSLFVPEVIASAGSASSRRIFLKRGGSL